MKHCGNCKSFEFDKRTNKGRAGECTCPQILAQYNGSSLVDDGFTVRSVGRYANQGTDCKWWRSK